LAGRRREVEAQKDRLSDAGWPQHAPDPEGQVAHVCTESASAKTRVVAGHASEGMPVPSSGVEVI
jgi:hypothetical protein